MVQWIQEELDPDVHQPLPNQPELTMAVLDHFIAEDRIPGPCSGVAADLDAAMCSYIKEEMLPGFFPASYGSSDSEGESVGSSSSPRSCHSSSSPSNSRQLPHPGGPKPDLAGLVEWMKGHQGEWTSPRTA